MTTRDEQILAVNNTLLFLYELLDSKKTPRVSKAVRRRAWELLKHYPLGFDTKEMFKKRK